MSILTNCNPVPATATLTALTINGPLTVLHRPNRRTRNNLLRQVMRHPTRPRAIATAPNVYQLTF